MKRREGSSVCVEGGEGLLYRRGKGIPLRGVRQLKEEFLLLFVPLFMVVTTSST
jgi:hypothetical protein